MEQSLSIPNRSKTENVQVDDEDFAEYDIDEHRNFYSGSMPLLGADNGSKNARGLK